MKNTENEWNTAARRFLKIELKRSGITYEALAERLTAMGKPETHVSVKSKIGRGTFSGAFLLAALKAIGRKVINIEEI